MVTTGCNSTGNTPTPGPTATATGAPIGTWQNPDDFFEQAEAYPSTTASSATAGPPTVSPQTPNPFEPWGAMVPNYPASPSAATVSPPTLPTFARADVGGVLSQLPTYQAPHNPYGTLGPKPKSPWDSFGPALHGSDDGLPPQDS
jgi:hypothetical protein